MKETEERQLRKEFDKRVKTLKLDKQAKEELFNRFSEMYNNGFKCAYCGKRMELKFQNEYGWTIDHIFPRAKGGKDEISNLEFVCRACNFLKGEMNPEQYINNLKRLKLRKQKREYFKAKKATKKDEGTREAFKDIFLMVNAKKGRE